MKKQVKPVSTRPIGAGCGPGKLGVSCNWVPPLESKNQTELDLKTLGFPVQYADFIFIAPVIAAGPAIIYHCNATSTNRSRNILVEVD